MAAFVFWGQCKKCGKSRNLRRRQKTGQMICVMCYEAGNRQICSGCKKLRRIAKVLEDGTKICQTCYQKDPARFEKCSECEEDHPVEARRGDGRPLCRLCHRQEKRRKKAGAPGRETATGGYFKKFPTKIRF